MSTTSLATARAAVSGTPLHRVMDAVNARGAFLSVTYSSPTRTAAKHGVSRQKITTAVVRTGVEYANLAQNAGRETGALPWGAWDTAPDGTSLYPWIIVHTGKDGVTRRYLRLYVATATLRTHVRSQYYVDGVRVDRAAFLAYDSPSVRAKANEVPDMDTLTMSVDLANITAIGSHAVDPTA